jgi:DNA-binding MarR family transcriptional regulator
VPRGTAEDAAHAEPNGTPETRARLVREVLDEFAAHTPAKVMHHLRRWPSGPVSLVHLHVLGVLDEEGPLPMRALAEALDVSQASATGIVDRMEQRGLVERRRGDADRRVIRVAQTAAGRELLAGIAAQRSEHFAALLDDLTDDELRTVLAGSRALRGARERLHATHGAEPPASGGPA